MSPVIPMEVERDALHAEPDATKAPVESAGIVSAPVNQPPFEHSWEGVIGAFADDPLWDEFIAAMEESRREIDARFYPVEE